MAHLNPKLTHLILELAHSNLRKRSRKRRRRGKRKRRGGRKGRGREESRTTNGSNKKY